MRSGIPFDVAFALDQQQRIAWSVIFSEFESGKKFNWATLKYEDPKE